MMLKQRVVGEELKDKREGERFWVEDWKPLLDEKTNV
jgi:hypothetical protein